MGIDMEMTAVALVSALTCAAFRLWRYHRRVSYLMHEADDLRHHNQLMQESIAGWEHCHEYGCFNVKVVEHTVPAISSVDRSAYHVIACDPVFTDKQFIIKRFPYDPYDADDKAFKQREAEELMEKLLEP